MGSPGCRLNGVLLKWHLQVHGSSPFSLDEDMVSETPGAIVEFPNAHSITAELSQLIEQKSCNMIWFMCLFLTLSQHSGIADTILKA